ncbi:MAG TPA: hypothetical protein VGG13_03115 [Candidatus Saccharimonadales bacterium]|jgi:hypothetical protein
MQPVTPTKRVLFRHCLKLVVAGLFAALSFLLSTFFVAAPTALAATNNTINFQARLESASGSIVPDGYYDVEFKLYTVSSSGTAEWTEDYTYNSGSGQCSGPLGGNDCRVQVSNGYLSVNLGSISSFPSTINWDQQQWLGLNIGGTVTGGSFPGIGDGEMSPRLQLTGVPYAFRAGQLAQYNSTTGYTSTLSLLQPTGGNQLFQLPDMLAAGTYTLLTTQTANGSYIQNQNSGAQSSSNFWISGTGIAGTALQTPILDAASAGGTLAIGSTNANTGNVNIGTGATTGNIAIGGSSQTGNITITTGGGTINIGSSASAGNVNIGNGSASRTVNIGGSGANTISIGNTQAGGSISLGAAMTTGTVAIGGTGQTGGLTLQGNGIVDTITGATSNPTDILKAASTSAFQVQNSSGYNELKVDTSGNKVTLGDSGHSVAGSLVFADGTADGFGATLNTATLTANETISLPNTGGVGGTICLQSSSACGFIQNQSSTAQSANFYIQGASGTATTAKIAANNGGSGDILDLQNGTAATVLAVDYTGNVHIEPSATPSYALEVDTPIGSPEFRVGAGQTILGSSSGVNGQLEFLNNTNINHLILQSGVTGSATLTLTLPTALGSAGSCLEDTTGSGVLGFASCESATGTDFIQNQNAGPQSGANFNIAGTGTVGALAVSGTANVKTTSTAAFQVQSAGSAQLFNVDTSTSTVTIGTATEGVVFQAGTFEPVLEGSAMHTRQITLAPEYAGATMTGSGTNNTGTMTSDNMTTSPFRNYYEWKNIQGTAQNYDIWVRVPLPSDWAGWPSGQTICLDTYASANSANLVNMTVYDTTNTAVVTSADLSPLSVTTWATNKCTSSITGGSFTAGHDMTIDIKMTAPATTGDVRIGDITFSYLSKW